MIAAHDDRVAVKVHAVAVGIGKYRGDGHNGNRSAVDAKYEVARPQVPVANPSRRRRHRLIVVDRLAVFTGPEVDHVVRIGLDFPASIEQPGMIDVRAAKNVPQEEEQVGPAKLADRFPALLPRIPSQGCHQLRIERPG